MTAAPEPRSRRGAASWPVYVGGFIGPFGGAMVSPMLPELRDALHTSLAVIASNMSFYLVPFAICLLWSGTLAEIWGRRRTLLFAYLAYAAASVVCALASSAPLFLAGRVGQGIANAFTTPILMSVLVEITEGRRLGRVLGFFGSVQAAGLTFAPMIGGLCAALDWRLAFWTTMAAALGLAVVPLPTPDTAASPTPQEAPSAADRWRSLFNAPLALASTVAALNYFTVMGLTLLGVLLADDRFDLPPQGRGLVVGSFGVAGLIGGGYVGRLLERLGPRRFGVAASIAMVAACVLAALAPAALVLFAALFLGGLAGMATRVSVNSLAVNSAPANRGGAASFMLACQFLGGSISPVLLVPFYRHHPTLGMVVAAAGAALATLVLAAAPARLLSVPEPTPARPSP
ncbi:MAG: MFS transporter [Nocardioides sp.]